MNSRYNYKVRPVQISKPIYEKKERSDRGYNFLILILVIVAVFALATKTEGGLILAVLSAILAIITLILKIAGNNVDDAKAKVKAQQDINIAEGRQMKSNQEAETYSHKLNSLLFKSDEIINYILPNYESLARKSIEIAKNDFKENAFSPFWSKIEDASNALACFKEALTQLCLNSELYTKTLKHLNHNFPLPFPFSTKISISDTIEDYKTIIRKAHTIPTFSFIWEQRRNTQVLIGGFKTLEDAIFNMSNDIYSVIDDLKISIKSNFDEIKYLQSEQVETLRDCEATLNQTLKNMDTKLYYIE